MLYLVIERKESLPKSGIDEAGSTAVPLTTGDAGASNSTGKGKGYKTRSFAAYPLGWITADNLWSGGLADTKNVRPIWLALASTEQQLRAFVANIQTGRKAELHESQATHTYGRSAPTRFEFLKSAGYRYSWLNLKPSQTQSEENRQEYKGKLATGNHYQGSEPKITELVTADGSAGLLSCTVYLPELFRVETGDKNPPQAKFVMLCPNWWHERELAKLNENSSARLKNQIVAHLEMVLTATGLAPKLKQNCAGFTAEDWLALVPQAAYFAAYLEQRTPRPLVSSLGYYLQLYVAALAEGLAFLPHQTPATQTKLAWASAKTEQDLQVHHAGGLGMLTPVGFSANRARINQLLANETRLYFLAQERLPEAYRLTDADLAFDQPLPDIVSLPATSTGGRAKSAPILELPSSHKRPSQSQTVDKSA